MSERKRYEDCLFLSSLLDLRENPKAIIKRLGFPGVRP